MGNTCNDCMARIPYATLIATIMCCLGVGIFSVFMHKGATLTNIMLIDVFRIQLTWLEPLQYTFATIGVSMAALGFMILCVGCLTTGATRHKVYRAWRSRVGGRISCAVFMAVTYILTVIWLLVFAALIIITVSFTFFWKICNSDGVEKRETCIDFTQFSFVFPDGHKNEYMKACESRDIKIFCRDTVEKAYVPFIFSTIASVLVIMSLIHYLMCLSANYAHIRDHEKFQELQELQYLQDPGDGESPQHGMGTLSLHHRSKDRF
ncbi:neuronal membrane glycoprotein M6-a isoform X2 [Aphidius gifuensis]|uniref:neuronal membrane glycoprotein M6-a isoform X2 n=1 Tax=Aphidius gifuensis TaxID=684658 RepID=UPI001CDC581B|nr:neuronal membrane glycoprotein M6-a isoform X2 [Aphidius gifuensis]